MRIKSPWIRHAGKPWTISWISVVVKAGNCIISLRRKSEAYPPFSLRWIPMRLNECLKYVSVLPSSCQGSNRSNTMPDAFEQEMIFYIEKLDITEEKLRLSAHLNYFLETLGGEEEYPESGQGKKLGFIAQEIGREINTLGSKSNHAGMQKIVVMMKDELEQIKEQVLNVL